MEICGRRVKICCMKSEIAVMIIGCLKFVASLIMIFILGLSIGVFEREEMPENTVIDLLSVLIWMMIFYWCYLITSALLIYASTVKKWAFAVPWLVWEILGLAAQVIILTLFGVGADADADADADANADTDADIESKIFIVTLLSLVLSVYFWLSVLSALLEWKEESKDRTTPTSPCRYQVVGFNNREVPSKVQIESPPVYLYSTFVTN